jgi:hypothetical protein
LISGEGSISGDQGVMPEALGEITSLLFWDCDDRASFKLII